VVLRRNKAAFIWYTQCLPACTERHGANRAARARRVGRSTMSVWLLLMKRGGSINKSRGVYLGGESCKRPARARMGKCTWYYDWSGAGLACNIAETRVTRSIWAW